MLVIARYGLRRVTACPLYVRRTAYAAVVENTFDIST